MPRLLPGRRGIIAPVHGCKNILQKYDLPMAEKRVFSCSLLYIPYFDAPKRQTAVMASDPAALLFGGGRQGDKGPSPVFRLYPTNFI